MDDIIIQKNGILNIKFNDNYNCDRTVKNIIDIYEKNKNGKILIETCSHCSCNDRSVLEQFDAGDSLAKYFYGKGVQMGVLGNCNLFSHFTETVAKNRGLYIKVSDDKDIISDWM